MAGASAPPASVPSGAALYCESAPCYTPHQFRAAYGLQPVLDRGIDGRGKTVTVLVPVPHAAGEATDIRRDLASFDSTFRLPAARIEVVARLAGSAMPWQATGEEVGDTEIVHAVAPAAALRVVLFPSDWAASAANATADMLAGLRLAVSHTDVASISWSLGEHYFTAAQAAELHSILKGAAAHNVTVIGSSGNGGEFSVNRFGGTQVKEVSLPASDPLALGVGGTTLTANRSTGAYIGETAWSDSGGGFSHLYARPAYQADVPAIAKDRGVPDVAGEAEEGGLARVETAGDRASLTAPGGTSDSAPLWGDSSRWPTSTPTATSGSSTRPSTASAEVPPTTRRFMTSRTGTNGFPAAPGWDPVTGWGSPDAQVLIPLLAGFAGRG